MLCRLAVKVSGVPWAGLGDTVAGPKLSPGAGFVGVNPQVPEVGASLSILSCASAYKQPSGPMTPAPMVPLASVVRVEGFAMSISSRLPPELVINDTASPLASVAPIWRLPSSEVTPGRVVTTGGAGMLVPAIRTIGMLGLLMAAATA